MRAKIVAQNLVIKLPEYFLIITNENAFGKTGAQKT